MANIEYSNYLEGLPTAPDPLSGDEIIGASKDGDAVGLTAQQIADLAPPGGGTVTSVSGTTNRITSTGGATPVIDIDAAYDAAVQAIADAKVADAINNGTTSVAPSQNAVFDALALKADLNSPAFTGSPTSPTPSAGDSDTSIATTAFVQGEVRNNLQFALVQSFRNLYNY